MRWENRGDGWELGGFEKVSYHIHLAPEEVPEPFDAQDVAQLAEILPRVRQAFYGHGRSSFNRVANGLNFFETGYRLDWGPVRFVMFTTALESLFITKDGSITKR